MRCARMAWAQCCSLSVGRSENLSLVAHIVRGTMLGIVRANETTSRWFIVMFILLGIGVLTFHRRLLISRADHTRIVDGGSRLSVDGCRDHLGGRVFCH